MENIGKIASCIAVLSALLLGAGCASAPKSVMLASSSVLSPEDRSMWEEADREEAELLALDASYRDSALESYLTGVADRLRPSGAPAYLKFRIHVMRDSSCNAFAMPNGCIFVNTGLLARIENEAQIATILGHEMAHVLFRHAALRSAQADESAKKARYLSAAGYLIAGGIGMYAVEDMSFRSSTAGYSRDTEREADSEGFRMAQKSGYDMTQAPAAFRHLIKDLEDFGEDGSSCGMYSDHPALNDRIDSFNGLLREYRAANGAIREREYRSAVRGVLADTIAEVESVSRFRVAAEFARRYVSAYPKDPLGYCLSADILRQEKGGQAERAAIADLYRKALAADQRCGEAFRGLGLEAFRDGRWNEARQSLSTYLSLRPGAWDREYIKGYIRECK